MASRYVHILLVLVCTMLAGVTAPSDGVRSLIQTGSTLASTATSMANMVNTYSMNNFYRLHFDCYRWCWVVIGKERRRKCGETKKSTCPELKQFGYKSFVTYQLTRLGMGKVAMTLLGVPGAGAATAGLQIGASALTTVSGGMVDPGKALNMVGGVVGNPNLALGAAKTGVDTLKGAANLMGSSAANDPSKLVTGVVGLFNNPNPVGPKK